jgi:hypothetical protein
MGLFLGALLAAFSLPTPIMSMSTTGGHVWPPMQLPLDAAIDKKYKDYNGQVLGVDSQMNYCAPHVTHIQTRRDLGGTDSALEGAAWDPTTVRIHNARAKDPLPSLDTQGFQLETLHLLHKNHLPTVDFKNTNQVIDDYYPVCQELLKKITGAAVVRAFDHNVRVSGSQNQDRQGDTVLHQPVGVVHNDYTHISAPRRLSQLAEPPKANDSMKTKILEQGVTSLLDPSLVDQVLQGKRRFAFVNVWKNIQPSNTPIQQFPLACVDATTQEITDFLTFQIIYADRIGENYFARATPRHQWYYFPNLLPSEVLLLKQWDSQGTLALQKNDNNSNNIQDMPDFTSTFSLHSAFQDPSSPPDAPPRESIEVRCVLIWDPK